MALIKDITEQKKAEEELRKLSQAVEQSPASVIITDIDGKIQYVNPKFSKVSGYSKKEVIGQNPRILKSGKMSDEIYTNLWQTIISGREWFGEFHNKKRTGSFTGKWPPFHPLKIPMEISLTFSRLKKI